MTIDECVLICLSASLSYGGDILIAISWSFGITGAIDIDCEWHAIVSSNLNSIICSLLNNIHTDTDIAGRTILPLHNKG
jgi:hypothetical protein